MQLVYDSLVWKNQEGNIIPQLAKKWQYDEENYQYIFELNEGVKWHDGKDFSADDVVFTIEYIKDHKLPWLDLEIIREAKVINKNQVAISLKNHYSPFMNIVASGMPIIPKHIFENVDNPYNSEEMMSCVGCGPYIFKDYSPEHGSYDFEGFEDYYNGDVKVKKIKFLSMNPEILSSTLIRSEVDLIMPSHESLKTLVDEGFNVKRGRGLINKLVFNTEKEPFDKLEFRKAMAYAINRQEIVDIAQRGNGVIGETGIVPIDSQYYHPKQSKYTYSLDRSREIMSALGYKIDGGYFTKDGKLLEIELMGYEDIKRDIDVIVKQLNSAGFKTTVKMYDLASCDENLMNKNFDITITEDGIIGDPIYINRMILAETGPKFRKEHKDFMNKISLQLYTTTEEERNKILSEIQADYSELLPAYVLYYGKFNVAYNDKIDVYFTKYGYSTSMNLPFNKLMFLKE